MAHELAGLRRVFRLEFDGTNLSFSRDSELDVSQMANNGNLAHGTRRTNEDIPITGRAFNHQGVTFFTFTQEDRPGAFVGRVVIRRANQAVVMGGFSRNNTVEFTKLSQKELEELLAQVEEPWVITKP